MKKVVLAVLLLVLLVSIGYFKVLRVEKRVDTSYWEGKKAGEEDLVQAQEEADSLRHFVEQQGVVFAESLTAKELAYQEEVDSLKGTIDSANSQVENLKSRLKATASTKTGTKSPQVEKTPAKITQDEKILNYYKKKYYALPKDLSPYERRVALTEIREETAQHFNISVAELNRLRSKYKVAY